MNKNEILLILTDQWNDWEASYAIAVANSFSEYVVKTIATDIHDKISMGGIIAKVDYSIKNYQNFEHLAMIILPGAFHGKTTFIMILLNLLRPLSMLRYQLLQFAVELFSYVNMVS